MGARRVSVIVVSRGRPNELALALTALGQQLHPPFEIVVVADPAGIRAAQGHRLGRYLRTVPFDKPNIAAARNAGLRAAGGDIIAFLDDDAYAEPTWLAHLTAPFDDPAVAATGGYVRGRNGISFQWRARAIDVFGQHHDLDQPGDTARIVPPPPGMAIRTEGTNCAYRRAVLAELGGFDPAFRFFMDDADLNLRLAQTGAATCLVPLAQVVHVMAPSEIRAQRRVPRTLYEIGASIAYYLSRHAPKDQRTKALADLRGAERKRLIRHMVWGNCVPGDVDRLLAGFDAGAKDGAGRETQTGWDGQSAGEFQTIPMTDSETVILSGRPWQARALRDTATKLVDNGARASLFVLSPTTLFHKVQYRAPGYWCQSGGIFGRSVRSERLISMLSFQKRLELETARVAKIRGLAQT
ncbi:MAG: glycosyltransferase [Pseudomonadota bacterium]